MRKIEQANKKIVLIGREREREKKNGKEDEDICLDSQCRTVYTFIHHILRSLVFIDSLFISTKMVYLDKCSDSWLSTRVTCQKEKRTTNISLGKNLFPFFFFFLFFFYHLFVNVVYTYVYIVSRVRKKQIKRVLRSDWIAYDYTLDSIKAYNIHSGYLILIIKLYVYYSYWTGHRGYRLLYYADNRLTIHKWMKKRTKKKQNDRHWNQINYSSRYHYRFNLRKDRPFFLFLSFINDSWKVLVARAQ